MQQLAVAQFLPLIVGITVRYCWSEFADNLETLIGQAANVLLCILILWVLAQQLDAVLQIGLFPLIVIGLLALVSLWIGHFLGAMHVDAFRPAGEFKQAMDHWIRGFRNARPAKGAEKVLIPGDPEREMEQVRTREGIPLMSSVVTDLQKLGEEMGIPHPF